MTRLLFLPDENTVIQLEVEGDASQWVATINSGARPLPFLTSLPPGKLTASEFGSTVVVVPGVEKRTRVGGEVEGTVLSRRQLQVHELAVRGLSSGEIALLLRISRRTVNYHLNQARARIHQGGALSIHAGAASRRQGGGDAG